MGNGIILQGFEWYLSDDGNYYNMMKERATELKKTGFSAVWIPPVFKATNTTDVGYGIYDMYDIGEFDQKGSIRTKYGTKEELLEMIRAFHKVGIQVYADVVMNHKAGGDGTEKFGIDFYFVGEYWMDSLSNPGLNHGSRKWPMH